MQRFLYRIAASAFLTLPLTLWLPGLPAIAQESNLRPAIQNEQDELLVHSLLKSTIIALNQANATGNYTVLRGLGTSEFQNTYQSADLAIIFVDFRRENIDLATIVEFDPIFTQMPTLDAQNQLLLVGQFPTEPSVQFDLAFQFVEGDFKLQNISLNFGQN